mmetsp:Transcript_10389/g.29681  ORF Transcript_10389/g.29681 Transcript_10389/m.29681 type:complete len:214 (+) Transcript_10389:585-1226(+)
MSPEVTALPSFLPWSWSASLFSSSSKPAYRGAVVPFSSCTWPGRSSPLLKSGSKHVLNTSSLPIVKSDRGSRPRRYSFPWRRSCFRAESWSRWSGNSPVRAFSCKSRRLRFDKQQSWCGTTPVKRLPPSPSSTREVTSPKISRTSPCRSLLFTSKNWSCLLATNCSTMRSLTSPARKFPARFTLMSSGRFPRKGGTSPVRRLWLRSSSLSFSQ